MSGLAFEQVYASDSVPCAYHPVFFPPPKTMQRAQEIGHSIASLFTPFSSLRSPNIHEIMSWLDQNCLETTQPFSAFVDAARKSGNDSDVRELRIARATKELKLRSQRIFGGLQFSKCAAAQGGKAPPIASNLFTNLVDFTSDAVGIAFGYVLWLLADHGYRPEKVLWFVAGTLLFWWWYFRFGLRVVGFKPAGKTAILPIGPVFLFDRMLPAYQIREEHYNIEAFYKKAPRRQHRQGDSAPAMTMRDWGADIPVVKASDSEAGRVLVCLDIIRFIGLGFAIFLVAAINALVRS
jgi:hypothetical protein